MIWRRAALCARAGERRSGRAEQWGEVKKKKKKKNGGSGGSGRGSGGVRPSVGHTPTASDGPAKRLQRPKPKPKRAPLPKAMKVEKKGADDATLLLHAKKYYYCCCWPVGAR